MAAAPGPLRAAQRQMAIAQEIIGLLPTFRIDGNANADPDAVLSRARCEWRFKRVRDPLGKRCDRLADFRAIDRDGKFFPAEPGHDRLTMDFALETLGNRAQHEVAGRVSEHVVDLLEAVEPEHEQGDAGRPPLCRTDQIGEASLQHAPVGKPGQRVVFGQVSNTLNFTFADRNIAQDRSVSPPIASQRSISLISPRRFRRRTSPRSPARSATSTAKPDST